MRWVRLDIPCPPEATDLVAALVVAETGRGPSVESGAGEDLVEAYAPEAQADACRERLALRLAAAGPLLSACAHRIAVVPLAETDWEHAWREHFRSFRVGRRLVVKPSWETWPPREQPEVARPEDVILEIDPGGAFGTGSHATTQLALQALDRLVHRGCTVIDVGCGSGILSLAALELGAGRVVAFDVDPAAVECALANLRRHAARGAAAVLQADSLAAVAMTADLVVANINAELAVMAGVQAAPLLAPQGRYVTTGFLAEGADSVARRLAEAGLEGERTDRLDGWACLTLRAAVASASRR